LHSALAVLIAVGSEEERKAAHATLDLYEYGVRGLVVNGEGSDQDVTFQQLVKRWRSLMLMERREKIALVRTGLTRKNTVVHLTMPQNNDAMDELNKLTATAELQIKKYLIHIFMRYFADYRKTKRWNSRTYRVPHNLPKILVNFLHSVWQRLMQPAVLHHWLYYIFSGRISEELDTKTANYIFFRD